MSLLDVKLNTECVVKDIIADDEKTSLRLMELGVLVGSKIIVKNKSSFKKTLLVFFNSTCFTIKDEIAKSIMVNYV